MNQTPHGLNDSQFRQLLTDLQSATEVDITFGGIVTSSNSSFAITRTRGATTRELRNLVIHNGLGLGGQAMSRQCPVWVRDYPVAQGITHDYDPAVQAERLRAIFAIPLTVANEVRAVVYGALRRDVPLGDCTLKAADLAIRRHVRALDTERTAAREHSQPQATTAEYDAATAIRNLRSAHDELATIASGVTDAALRQQLNNVCSRMRAPLGGSARTPTVQLSPREVEVLERVAQGCKNSEIAEHLSIVPGTVKAYLESAMRKLGTNNRILTVNAARESGLLS